MQDLSTDSAHRVAFDEPAYMVWSFQGREWKTTTVRFSYMSLATPETVYDYNMDTRDRVMRKQMPVLGGFRPEDYETQRVFAPARDGAQIPVSLVFKKGTPLDGSAPLVLFGYGSYGLCMDAFFSPERISLLDRGIIWATAHIRGGMEMGWHWYESGKLLQKKNTFTDFIDCAEYLIGAGYTRADRLIAWGGSAGGMLVAAAC